MMSGVKRGFLEDMHGKYIKCDSGCLFEGRDNMNILFLIIFISIYNINEIKRKITRTIPS